MKGGEEETSTLDPNEDQVGIGLLLILIKDPGSNYTKTPGGQSE